MQNNLKEIRQSQKLASWGLSVKSGVSTSTITAIEKWDFVPSLTTQQKIATALEVDVEDIWEDADVNEEAGVKS